MLVERQDTNIALFLNVFLRILQKTYWVKRLSNKNFGQHFFMPTLAFSCSQTSTKVISKPSLSSLTQTIWLDVYKNYVSSFCGMCCTEWWSPNLVKSSGWTSGVPIAHILIGRVTGLCLVVIFSTVLWERSDRGQLFSSPSHQLVDGPGCSKAG